MNSIEELRYLFLAAQHEGDRLLSAALEPIELTTSQAEVLRVLYEYAPLEAINIALWRFIAGRPTGNALLRRKEKP